VRWLSVATVALLLIGCGGTPPTPSPAPATAGPALTRIVTGTLVLRNDGKVMRHGVSAGELNETNLPGPDNVFPCTGTGDFADVAPGAAIVVTDDRGATLDQTEIADDIETTYDKFPKAAPGVNTSPILTQCYYSFEFDDVADAASYTFKVGDHVGATVSAADLATQGWTVRLTLGS
jgi:hypothetical protein